MTTTAENIIDKVKFSYIEADEQKDLFSPSHMLYKCRITYGGRQFTFKQCFALFCDKRGAVYPVKT